MERPKELPRVLVLGPGSNRLDLLLALAANPPRAPIMAPLLPPPAPALKEQPVLARVGSFLRRRGRRARETFFAPSIAPNGAEILARLNAFYSQRPRPWRPRANAPRVRRRAYTAPKGRACS